MDNNLNDVQTQKISTGIRNLLQILNSKLSNHIFDLQNDAENIAYYNLIKRLQRSLEQFSKRTNNLFYIGFLGHYSSGKSSTINSLLNLRGQKEERVVSLNPTDDQITLITDIKNNEEVVKLIRVGSVPVVISHMEGIPFLHNRVIIDTPGTGDPNLLEELVRDSLPLCDLIIYCISATNPLDNSDIPLLKEKEANLNQIPTIYLITRGNEFKVESFGPLSENNFNYIESKKTLSHLASRMKNIVETIELSYEDFIIIDNKEGYNLNYLDSRIDQLLNPENSTNITKLYSHKIDFYLRTSQGVKDHFAQIISHKLSTITSFVQKAKKNIDEYDKQTILGSDTLVTEWKNIDDRIKTILDGSIYENNRIISTLNSPANLLNNEAIKDWHKKLSSTFNENNEIIVRLIVSQIRSKIDDCKNLVKSETYNSLEENKVINKSEINTLLYDLLHLNEISINLQFTYPAINNEFHILTGKEIHNPKFENFKRNYESVLYRVRSSNPLESIGKHVDSAKSILKQIFQSYNDAVKIYRIAAFSAEAKAYIRKLGLSEQLDELDNIAPEISSYLLAAESEIFNRYFTELHNFKTECLNIEEQLRSFKFEYLPSKSTEVNEIFKEMELKFLTDLKDEMDRLYQVIKEKINEFFLHKIDEINFEIYNSKTKSIEEIASLKKRRMREYCVRLIPSGLVLLFTIFIFAILPKWNIDTVNLSIGWQWVLSILSNLAFASLNFLFAKSKDKFNDKKIQIENKYQVHERQIIGETIEKGYEEFRIEALTMFKNKITVFINDIAKRDLSLITSRENNMGNYIFYDSLTTFENAIKKQISHYSEAIVKLKRVIGETLNNTKLNKEQLFFQAANIKENSISPSFKLLNTSENDIKDLFTKINQLKFS